MTTKTAHTPGPWAISHGGFPTDDGFSIATRNSASVQVHTVCECWPCTITGNDHRAELLANARLIAAAPELLAALHECYAIVALQNGNLHDDINQILARARAAITAAEGE